MKFSVLVFSSFSTNNHHKCVLMRVLYRYNKLRERSLLDREPVTWFAFRHDKENGFTVAIKNSMQKTRVRIPEKRWQLVGDHDHY